MKTLADSNSDTTDSDVRRIIVHNHKGGTGKTMLSVHLTEFMADQGQFRHMYDADEQHNAISWMTGHAWQGEEALQLPGDGQRPQIVVTVAPGIAAQQPHLVVDTPPAGDALKRIQDNGIDIGPEDMVVCPVSGRFGIDGAIKVAEEVHSTGCRVVAVLNKTDPKSDHAAEEIRAVQELEDVEDLGIEVFKMTIPRNDKYIRQAELQGKPVWEIPHAKRTHTVRSLRAFARWMAQGAPPEANQTGQLGSTEESGRKQERVRELSDRLWS
jgi:cellulose biosynthesis protein BcsQ